MFLLFRYHDLISCWIDTAGRPSKKQQQARILCSAWHELNNPWEEREFGSQESGLNLGSIFRWLNLIIICWNVDWNRFQTKVTGQATVVDQESKLNNAGNHESGVRILE